jgi:general L-amino acid transport system ATP-binding protein
MTVHLEATPAALRESSVAPAIRAENVSKSFGATPVLRNISLTANQGERIVICGPSGSGKSTLIRCLNGLEKHDDGRIVIGDVELDGSQGALARIAGRVGMVFQSFNLFPHLTVLENCMLAPRKVLGKSRSQAEDTARQYLERVRVPEHADKYPSQLSGGQQQRVAIARALCMQPKLMLYDEPTSALDPEMIREVLDTIADLAKAGMTTICVTHEMGFARQVADRVFFMDHGQIVESGPPDLLFDRPRTERLQTFLEHVLRSH